MLVASLEAATSFRLIVALLLFLSPLAGWVLLFLLLCVCVRVCVCARACVCVCCCSFTHHVDCNDRSGPYMRLAVPRSSRRILDPFGQKLARLRPCISVFCRGGCT